MEDREMRVQEGVREREREEGRELGKEGEQRRGLAAVRAQWARSHQEGT